MKPIFKLSKISKFSEISTSYFVSGDYLDGSSDLHIIKTILPENQIENPKINLKLKYEWLKKNYPELLI